MDSSGAVPALLEARVVGEPRGNPATAPSDAPRRNNHSQQHQRRQSHNGDDPSGVHIPAASSAGETMTSPTAQDRDCTAPLVDAQWSRHSLFLVYHNSEMEGEFLLYLTRNRGAIMLYCFYALAMMGIEYVRLYPVIRDGVRGTSLEMMVRRQQLGSNSSSGDSNNSNGSAGTDLAVVSWQWTAKSIVTVAIICIPAIAHVIEAVVTLRLRTILNKAEMTREAMRFNARLQEAVVGIGYLSIALWLCLYVIAEKSCPWVESSTAKRLLCWESMSYDTPMAIIVLSLPVLAIPLRFCSACGLELLTAALYISTDFFYQQEEVGDMPVHAFQRDPQPVRVRGAKYLFAFCAASLLLWFLWFLEKNIRREFKDVCVIEELRMKARALHHSLASQVTMAVPPFVARRLLAHTKVRDHSDEAVILAFGIPNFQQMCSRMSSAEVVGLLNRVFCDLDDALATVSNGCLTKMQTLGDLYLCVGGLFLTQHAARFLLAQSVQLSELDYCRRRYVTHRIARLARATAAKLQLATGSATQSIVALHVGPATGAVLGSTVAYVAVGRGISECLEMLHRCETNAIVSSRAFDVALQTEAPDTELGNPLGRRNSVVVDDAPQALPNDTKDDSLDEDEKDRFRLLLQTVQRTVGPAAAERQTATFPTNANGEGRADVPQATDVALTATVDVKGATDVRLDEEEEDGNLFPQMSECPVARTYIVELSFVDAKVEKEFHFYRQTSSFVRTLNLGVYIANASFLVGLALIMAVAGDFSTTDNVSSSSSLGGHWVRHDFIPSGIVCIISIIICALGFVVTLKWRQETSSIIRELATVVAEETSGTNNTGKYTRRQISEGSREEDNLTSTEEYGISLHSTDVSNGMDFTAAGGTPSALQRTELRHIAGKLLERNEFVLRTTVIVVCAMLFSVIGWLLPRGSFLKRVVTPEISSCSLLGVMVHGRVASTWAMVGFIVVLVVLPLAALQQNIIFHDFGDLMPQADKIALSVLLGYIQVLGIPTFLVTVRFIVDLRLRNTFAVLRTVRDETKLLEKQHSTMKAQVSTLLPPHVVQRFRKFARTHANELANQTDINKKHHVDPWLGAWFATCIEDTSIMILKLTSSSTATKNDITGHSSSSGHSGSNKSNLEQRLRHPGEPTDRAEATTHSSESREGQFHNLIGGGEEERGDNDTITTPSSGSEEYSLIAGLERGHTIVDRVLLSHPAVCKAKVVGDIFFFIIHEWEADVMRAVRLLECAAAITRAFEGERDGPKIVLNSGLAVGAVIGADRLTFELFGEVVSTSLELLNAMPARGMIATQRFVDVHSRPFNRTIRNEIPPVPAPNNNTNDAVVLDPQPHVRYSPLFTMYCTQNARKSSLVASVDVSTADKDGSDPSRWEEGTIRSVDAHGAPDEHSSNVSKRNSPQQAVTVQATDGTGSIWRVRGKGPVRIFTLRTL